MNARPVRARQSRDREAPNMLSATTHAVLSCPLICLRLQRQVAKLANGLLYSRSLLRNNNTAIILQMFTSSYGRVARSLEIKSRTFCDY